MSGTNGAGGAGGGGGGGRGGWRTSAATCRSLAGWGARRRRRKAEDFHANAALGTHGMRVMVKMMVRMMVVVVMIMMMMMNTAVI